MLKDYDLRFLVEEAPDGVVKIAFADKSGEAASMARIVLTSAAVFPRQ